MSAGPGVSRSFGTVITSMHACCLMALLLGSEQCVEKARSDLQQTLKTLHSSSVAFVPANVTINILKNYEPSVDDAAVQASFAKYWDVAVPQRDEQGREVYEFKDTLVSYFSLLTSSFDGLDFPDESEHFDRLQRSTDKVYVNRTSTPDESSSSSVTSDAGSSDAPPSDVIEYIDPTTAHDVSFFRVHRAWPDDADAHPISRAMLSLLHTAVARVAAFGAYEAMMSAMRVRRSDTEPRYKAGDPGPEGVHQDSAVLTVVLLMDRVNVAAHTGGNRVWSLEQPAGKPAAADLRNASRLKKSVMLRDRFDMLLVMDREVKHEACAIEAADAGEPAVRDVLTFEVRRVTVESLPET